LQAVLKRLRNTSQNRVSIGKKRSFWKGGSTLLLLTKR
jgi:hypothetical protein